MKKIAARKALIAETGAVFKWFSRFEKQVKEHSHPSGFLFDKEITHADVSLFVCISNFNCAWLDGIELKWVDNTFPHLKKFREHFLAIPTIKAFYEKNNTGIRKNYNI